MTFFSRKRRQAAMKAILTFPEVAVRMNSMHWSKTQHHNVKKQLDVQLQRYLFLILADLFLILWINLIQLLIKNLLLSQKIDYSFLKDSDEEKSNDSEPEMFDNVLEKSIPAQGIIDGSDFEQEKSEEETPIKKPPAKRKLGPKPAPKRKIESSGSEASPVKKKVILIYLKSSRNHLTY